MPRHPKLNRRELYDRKEAGPRLDYRKSHHDRWAKSCLPDDPRCIALHLAVTGMPIIKTTMAARYEESLFVGGL